jgi:hypothetical protein
MKVMNDHYERCEGASCKCQDGYEELRRYQRKRSAARMSRIRTGRTVSSYAEVSRKSQRKWG